QRVENGGTAARAIAMLPALTGAWRHQGGGAQLSTSGAFSWDENAVRRPDLEMASPLGRRARTVNMCELGHALTELGRTSGQGTADKEQAAQESDQGSETGGRSDSAACGDGPAVHALFVYNSNPGAVAPNHNAVVRGLGRPDLFTVVHDLFFND